MKYVYPTTQAVLNVQQSDRISSIRCPSGSHRDSTPSLVLYPDGGFYCFGCNRSGKHGLDFLIKVLGNSYGDSMDYLKEKGLI